MSANSSSGRSSERAVLLDFDGVLVDTIPLYIQVWREVLAKYRRVATEDAARELIGLRNADALALISQHFCDPRLAAHEVAEMDARLWELVDARGSVVVPGAESLLGALTNAEIPAALVTSSSTAVVEKLAPSLALRLQVVVCEEQVVNGKPDPEGYLLACQHLGVSPSDALVVEDSPIGVQAGLHAGCRVAAVSGTWSAAELAEAGADFVFSSLLDENLLHLMGLGMNE